MREKSNRASEAVTGEMRFAGCQGGTRASAQKEAERLHLLNARSLEKFLGGNPAHGASDAEALLQLGFGR